MHGEVRSVYIVLWIARGKRGKRWESNMGETGCEKVHCIKPAQFKVFWLAFVNAAVKFWVPNKLGMLSN